MIEHIKVCSILTVTILWANLADDKLMIFLSSFPESRLCHFMQIKVSYLGKIYIYIFFFPMLSAEIFPQDAKH